MENLKEWAAIICSVAVGSVFTVFLVPDGKMKKQAETVISLVFLLLVVSFVTDIKPSELVKFPEFDDDFIENINEDMMKGFDAAVTVIKKMVREKRDEMKE